MMVDRPVAESQQGGDLAVGAPFGDMACHPELLRREAGQRPRTGAGPGLAGRRSASKAWQCKVRAFTCRSPLVLAQPSKLRKAARAW
jgi:hypothetical protein